MWKSNCERLPEDSGLRFAIQFGSSSISFSEVLHRWQGDESFRAYFNSLLADAPFSAFRWETPPITSATENRPFECVLLNSPGLAREPEPNAFAQQFTSATNARGVVEFANLGNDAILVVPCPIGPASAYGHIAAFVRKAPVSQRDALWELVGNAMQRRLSTKPVWLSTAGAGVSWLHVRLDDRPKYYGFEPYRLIA